MRLRIVIRGVLPGRDCPTAGVYDRDVKDIFAVEDESAGAIVGSVPPLAGQSAAFQGR